jgi:protein-S-isoprenylcysteine O-methyltransferase Ste14
MDAEERLLEETFGERYRAYRARTTRLVPGIY